ncbi:unnamed protein product [Cyclocybe aegerita]|uniref:Uncharacterized protein n=1 Tax=Cyclocybe aegerita TaxID=1973307 RepID=A0A8S0WCV0_CYCAE|nr:unnamed protein product [Cyclocybe aegerita]
MSAMSVEAWKSAAGVEFHVLWSKRLLKELGDSIEFVIRGDSVQEEILDSPTRGEGDGHWADTVVVIGLALDRMLTTRQRQRAESLVPWNLVLGSRSIEVSSSLLDA